jgi:hypothetical protein
MTPRLLVVPPTQKKEIDTKERKRKMRRYPGNK